MNPNDDNTGSGDVPADAGNMNPTPSDQGADESAQPAANPSASTSEASKCDRCGMEASDGKCNGCQMESGTCTCPPSTPTSEPGTTPAV